MNTADLLTLVTGRTFWMVVYGIIIISVILLILLENRNPLKAVAWVMVLILLPAVGLIVYIFFGQDNRRKFLITKDFHDRILSNATPCMPVNKVRDANELGSFEALSALILTQTGNPVVGATSIELYTAGIDKFKALMSDIENARHHIHLQYYVFEDDNTSTALMELLCKKAGEGVKVRVIYDYVGSWGASSRFFKNMRKGGVDVYPFMPVAFPIFASRVNYRNHRKAVIIDGHIGYVGGMNVADRYTTGGTGTAWRDTHIRVEGMVVNSLQASFTADYYVASKRILPTSIYQEFAYREIKLSEEHKGRSIPMQIFQSGPTGPFRIIIQALCVALYNAKKNITIETPYFLPNESLNRAILGAALRGVDVKLIIPETSDTFGLRFATSSYLDELMHAGVQVYIYEASFLHSKVLTIDGELTLMGSANMDFRSLEHNFELTCCIYDHNFTRRVDHMLEEDLASCSLLDRKKWAKRSIFRRLAESVMRLFAPLL